MLGRFWRLNYPTFNPALNIKGAKIMTEELEKRIAKLEKEVKRLVNFADGTGYELFKFGGKVELLEENLDYLDSVVDSLQD